MLKRFLLLTHLVLTMLTAPAAAFAGAPFVTDDPEPVARDEWEVNYAISKTWTDRSASTAAPGVDINYGFSDNIQLHAQPRYSIEKEGGQSHAGFDNTEIGIKYRFLNLGEDEHALMLGIYPMLQLPTGDYQLGGSRGKMQLFLPMWAQLNREKWTMYGGGGYRINRFVDSKNSWFVGATTLYAVSERFQIGAELFRESATEQDGQHTSGYNIGGVYDLSKDYHWLFSAGRGLNHPQQSNRLSVYMALQVIY